MISRQRGLALIELVIAVPTVAAMDNHTAPQHALALVNQHRTEAGCAFLRIVQSELVNVGKNVST